MLNNFYKKPLFAVGGEAGGYTLLEPSILEPGNITPNINKKVTLTEYANGVYIVLFIAIIVSAIIMLIYYGAAYMTSDIAKFKNDAQKRITNIFWGLAIALLSWLILNQINPDLASNLSFNFFKNIGN